MKNKFIKAKAERKRRAFSPNNGILTAGRDWGKIAEDSVLNRRRHSTLQKLAKTENKHTIRKIMCDKTIDNGLS